jgi:hypothetical protein
MPLTKQQIKQRYFDKVYSRALDIGCACGCGMIMKSKDRFGRDKKYIVGHNTPIKYADPTEYKRAWNHRNRKQRYNYRTKRLHQIKIDLIVQAGSQCVACGFEFDGDCLSVFDFHHRDPNFKELSLNQNSFNKVSKDKLYDEVKKCDLLCANCHRQLHWKLFKEHRNANTADTPEALSGL